MARGHEFIVAQLAVSVLVQLGQRFGRVFHLGHGNDTVAVGIDGAQQGVKERVVMGIIVNFPCISWPMRAGGRTARTTRTFSARTLRMEGDRQREGDAKDE